MILAIGEILFDIFPGYKRLGGAPFNFAAHLKNFGCQVHFVSGVGNDREGKEIKEHLNKNGFDLNYIQTDRKHSTGKVIVSLDKNGIPEYNILFDAAYDFMSYNDSIRNLQANRPDMIYIGTLIQRTKNGYKTIQEILANKDKAKCFYDVNLRSKCYNEIIIRSTLQHTNILKLNQEELFLIKNMFNIHGDEADFLQFIFENYPVELAVVTRGENGSSIYTASTVHSLPGNNNQMIADTVGAGDAFASIVAIGYLRSWDIAKINTTASDFASAICGIKGAIPEDNSIYTEFKSRF